MRLLYLYLVVAMTTACSAHPGASTEATPEDAPAQRSITSGETSGAPLSPEQGFYDVTRYELAVSVDPATRTIEGAVTVVAQVVHPLELLVLDLDQRLEVRQVEEFGARLPHQRQGSRIRIGLGRTRQPGESLTVVVRYGGTPRVAPNPPWDGGFTWSKTPSGAPWIATTCQIQGADLWWPCKDHPSDRADSAALRITVPRPLMCAANGRLISVDESDPDTRTFHWEVSTPINTYALALNIAPYEVLERDYQSVTGETFPVQFYVLPESRAQAEKFLPQFVDHLRFHEELFGPYPFRADKYGVVETPHLGMEHQTIIAYGNKFQNNEWGYDWLHHHELSHEWWANLVTAADYKDFWIHETFATYSQRLYVEKLHGREAYHKDMAGIRRSLANERPVAPCLPSSMADVYGGDVYYKGAWMLHTLRYLIGETAFFTALRRMAYPDPELENTTDGSACRYASAADFVSLVETLSNQELDWFFDVYLHQPDLPTLETELTGTTLKLHWRVPQDLPFPMPVEVAVDGKVRRIGLEDGSAELSFAAGSKVEVDPSSWILRESP